MHVSVAPTPNSAVACSFLLCIVVPRAKTLAARAAIAASTAPGHNKYIGQMPSCERRLARQPAAAAAAQAAAMRTEHDSMLGGVIVRRAVPAPGSRCAHTIVQLSSAGSPASLAHHSGERHMHGGSGAAGRRGALASMAYATTRGAQSEHGTNTTNANGVCLSPTDPGTTHLPRKRSYVLGNSASTPALPRHTDRLDCLAY